MKTIVTALISVGLLLTPAFTSAAFAAGPGEEPPPGDDLGVQLTDMFALVATVLSTYQDQTANEAYLGSASSEHRLLTAIARVPAVSVRGARPFVEGWIIGDD